jgi:small subunit ribosomal protein S21
VINFTFVPRDPLDPDLAKRFTRACLKAGLFKEAKRHDFYVKPGERRRLKAKIARAKIRKAARRQAAGEAARLLRLGMSADD